MEDRFRQQSLLLERFAQCLVIREVIRADLEQAGMNSGELRALLDAHNALIGFLQATRQSLTQASLILKNPETADLCGSRDRQRLVFPGWLIEPASEIRLLFVRCCALRLLIFDAEVLVFKRIGWQRDMQATLMLIPFLPVKGHPGLPEPTKRGQKL